MKFLWITTGLLLPSAVLALNYNTDTLPYTDIPTDHATQIAISTLTERGIVRGNPDGTFKPGVPINRAEFMQIAMGLLPPETIRISSRCFPDVDEFIWFAQPVCRAKALGIVSGNAQADINPDLWKFEPTRSVKYEEALKILSRIYGKPLVSASGEWYEKYVRSAKSNGIDLPDSAAGSGLTRGQMARLVVGFVAYAQGELDELRYAQTHPFIPVRTVFDAPEPSSSSSVSSIASVSSSSSSRSSDTYDPLIHDTSTDDALLVLGKTTHVLGAAELFADTEPITVQEFIIDLVSANTSLEAMNVYDDRGKFLGRATGGGTRFTLSVKNKNIVLPRRDTYSFYVRGILRSQDSGGISGGSLQIDEMGIEGVGVWSNNDYAVMTSDEPFAQTSVARSAITDISNAGDTHAILIQGSDMEIGAFRFQGVTGHSAARLEITDIDFQIGLVGDVTLTNATMKVDGSSERHACTVSGDRLLCNSLPGIYGRLDDGTRTLRLFADISIPDTQQHAGLQLSLNDPGSISSPGDITWSDGVTSFTWIDSTNRPVARGTYYSY